MIYGTGIDIADVDRIAEKLDKNAGFRELVFTPSEIVYCEKMASKYEHYAARFAAKEAFLKAIGTGWVKGTAFNEIEIAREDTGKPVLFFLGKTAKTIDAMNLGRISLSMSHIKTMATAIVIIETR